MNQFLPVILPGVITLLVLAVFLGFFFSWVKDAQARQIAKRVALVITAITVLAVAIFVINSSVVSPGQTVDRTVQQNQERSLERRLQEGGH